MDGKNGREDGRKGGGETEGWMGQNREMGCKTGWIVAENREMGRKTGWIVAENREKTHEGLSFHPRIPRSSYNLDTLARCSGMACSAGGHRAYAECGRKRTETNTFARAILVEILIGWSDFGLEVRRPLPYNKKKKTSFLIIVRFFASTHTQTGDADNVDHPAQCRR
jgi:hypothetical protein